MIHTSRQLKDLVRNLSGGDSFRAQTILRNYVMERFLERLSLSRYRDNLILKGGVLVASIIGMDRRSTLDVDATIKNLSLTEADARKIVEEIVRVPLDDGMSFTVTSVFSIMGEAEYPGIRIILDTTLENMHTPLKIDMSTGDVITPKEVAYSYRLLFEERTISILAYNLETVLAEKLETLIARGTTNTRMRDFYDIYCIGSTQATNIDTHTLKEAFRNTMNNRGSAGLRSDMDLIVREVAQSAALRNLWKTYQSKNDYAAGISWDEIMLAVSSFAKMVL